MDKPRVCSAGKTHFSRFRFIKTKYLFTIIKFLLPFINIYLQILKKIL